MKHWKSITIILSVVFISSHALAASRSIEVKDRFGNLVGLYEKSHALLIGVSDYKAGWPDLETIPGELAKVESILKSQGFNVVKVMDPDSKGLKRSFEDFINNYGYNKNDRLLFYFSGHGYSRKAGKKGYLGTL
jgi:caspase domain-containing protein